MHSTFGTSRLVRLLGQWTPVDEDRSAMDFAERTSLWIAPLDAIRLQSAHQPVRRTPEAAPRQPARAPAAGSLMQSLQQARGVLAQAIAQDPLQLAGMAPGDPDFGYAPFRQRHLELQRQMEQMVTALRDHVRQAAGAASPRLRQLAALDAALESVFAGREQKLLPTAAALLERRFSQLRREQQQLAGCDEASSSSAEAEDPRTTPSPPIAAPRASVDSRVRGNDVDAWLHAFNHEWRQVLLAELDLRLEPVAGLLDALRNEPPHAP